MIDANVLEAHFDTAFDAPNGIQKLRELILTLAMQGKLVPQDPKDEPASELLKKIQAEKKRLVKEGMIKASRGDTEKAEVKGPYELPKGWVWTRLRGIGEINPRNDAADSTKAGFVPMPLISEGYTESHSFEERLWGEIKKGYTHFKNGDVGMAKITPCFENAKSCVFADLPNGIGAGTTELHIFRNCFSAVVPRFLLYFVKNPHYIDFAVPKMTGSAGQKRVSTTFFSENPFPLPPLAEQKRIVAKIDQLMARCDELETMRQERNAKRLSAHAAAIRELLSSSGSFAFLSSHFSEFYSVKENVSELRKAILQLAVMGKLVPQVPKDEPASELLKKIQEEKKRLVKEGKIKASRGDAEKAEVKGPYELPKGWVWCGFSDLVQVMNGRAYKQQELLNYGTPVLRVGNLFTSNHWYYSNLELEEDKYIEKGDLIYAWSASFGPFIWDGEKVIYHYHIWKLPLISPNNLDKYFLFKYLQNETDSIKKSGNGIAMMHMTKERMEKLPVPLPPLAEQKRIVAKIDQLMALCDSLEQQIDASTAKQEQLLSSLVSAV